MIDAAGVMQWCSRHLYVAYKVRLDYARSILCVEKCLYVCVCVIDGAGVMQWCSKHLYVAYKARLGYPQGVLFAEKYFICVWMFDAAGVMQWCSRYWCNFELGFSN